MEIVQQHQLQVLPLVPSECLAQSCVNFLQVQKLAADAKQYAERVLFEVCGEANCRGMA